jgi:hypothetical protein
MTNAEEQILELLEIINSAVEEIEALAIDNAEVLTTSDYQSILYLSGANWDRPYSIVGEAARWHSKEYDYGGDD